MEKVRFGIVGLGNMGTGHAHNVFDGKVPKLELTAICDIAEGRRAYAKEQFPDVTIFEDAEEMFKSGLVDAVIIATPHYDHPGLAIKALEAGLNVITEKPAGVYTKQVLEMNEAAEKSDKLFGIMYNQRMNPVYQQLRKMIQNGELGTIKRVNWIITTWYRCQTYHDSCTWRSTWKTEGGGALINQNPHQLDLWQWLFGMPSKIMSHVSFGKYYDIEVEDDLTAYMEYDNGMTGVYITSTGEAPGTNRLEIACDMGRVVVEDDKITFDRNVISEREYNANNKTEVFGTPECWKCEVPVKGENEAHVGILKDFTRALITGDHELLAPGSDGIKGLTISNAIHYSAWTGGWVDLKNFPHDDFKRILDEKIASSTVVKKDIQITANTRGSY
ncbi:MAG: Gfo/Idh/MocA family oxidoreductase [Clostridia bacterium]|nr:Gfo/Idh/MocA family oxidoreductase [Clostridia bacterium]